MTQIEVEFDKWELTKIDSAYLIKELYDRGIKVKDIFGRYYEFEEASNGRTIDVEDAELVGLAECGA